MKIKELILKNFRCFENASFQFNPDYNLHVLIAPNMKGKTAVMEALRIVLGSLLKRVSPYTPVKVDPADHLVKGNNLLIDVANECCIQTSAEMEVWNGKQLEPRNFDWKISHKLTVAVKPRFRKLNSEDPFEAIPAIFDRICNQEHAILPLLCYVGADYLNQDHRSSRSMFFCGGHEEGYWRCLKERDNYTLVIDWLWYSHAIAQPGNDLPHIYGDGTDKFFFESFQRLVIAMFPEEIVSVDWQSIHINGEPIFEGAEVDWKSDEVHLLAFRFANGEVREFEMLSQAWQYLILLAGELSMRCILLNRELEFEATEKTPGIVLIDDFAACLDQDLHQVAIHRLCKLFPRIQFIISSRNALLANGLNMEQVHFIEKKLNFG